MSEPHTLDELFSIAELQRDVSDLRDEVKELNAATKELVEAWRAAGSLVKFVKWASTFVTAIGILWIAARHFFGWGG